MCAGRAVTASAGQFRIADDDGVGAARRRRAARRRNSSRNEARRGPASRKSLVTPFVSINADERTRVRAAADARFGVVDLTRDDDENVAAAEQVTRRMIGRAVR